MTTTHKITAGPSKWDLMQSMFTGTDVLFTLDQNLRVAGVVHTLHKHRDEPRLSDNDADYHVNAARLDWLINLRFDCSRYPKICSAYIEYDMTTRTGISVLYDDDEFQNTDYPYLPDEWSRMMKL